ncbi:MAG TPA: hypothetical protein VGZ22_15270 [Isosphaeraceae bacterium]|jgi:F0F1-type ATP synthase beta subunit|nr:hypothetical protein [Isosphaeraceae bacterium]
MTEDSAIERIRDAIRRDRLRPAKERFDEMVRLGLIDKEGRVLVRMREPSGTRPRAEATSIPGKSANGS